MLPSFTKWILEYCSLKPNFLWLLKHFQVTKRFSKPHPILVKAELHIVHGPYVAKKSTVIALSDPKMLEPHSLIIMFHSGICTEDGATGIYDL